jgi:AraC-like DNA-binding protein
LSLSTLFEFLWLGSGGIFCILWSLQSFIENKNQSSFVWSLILGSTGVWLLVGSFFFTSMYPLIPEISLLHIPFVYLSAPLLYLYLEFIFLDKKIEIGPIYFLPAIFSLCLILPFYFHSHEEMLKIIRGEGNNIYTELIRILNLGVKLAIIVSVGLFLFKHLIPNLQWKIFLQKNAIFTFSFVMLIWIDLLIGTLGFITQMDVMRKVSAYLLPLILYFYFFTRSHWTPFLADIKDNIQKVKYEKSKISSIDLESLELKLKALIKEKIYCDEDLTLTRLAMMLEIKQGQLSEYFQRRYGLGFYKFINQHRIEEAKRMLLEMESRSILSIADAVGFNSKSTFNRVFSQIVGKTPREYRESAKKK